MLLAGGQGSRLYALTDKVAKPAVSFGAKYRIIDFVLSNCSYSGIDTVGVLTQYEPLLLNEYVGTGESWDLDRANGGVHILQPYHSKTGGAWYRGTANAIYQNRHFIKNFDCENVLILSGDHIYKMDYSKMLEEHEKSNADCTIAVIDVPKKEASRFGIMDYSKDKRILSFEEKPSKPRSNHASMGVYIFKKDVLLIELEADELNENSVNDFGKNIIPRMLATKKNLFAFEYDGYWKDVGTVGSLWEANMDLLSKKPLINLYDNNFKVFSKNSHMPPCFVADSAELDNSLLTAGCEIFGSVKNSIISEGVIIEEGAVVENSVIMCGSVIEKGARVEYAVVDEKTVIGANVEVLGDASEIKLVSG